MQEYGRRYGVDADTAEGLARIHSEMAADSMFDVFSNEKFIKDIVTENRTLAQKIKDFLTDLISELRGMINHFHEIAEMNALREQTEALEDIRSSFHNALRVASTEMQKSLQNEQKNNASRTKTTENAKNSPQHNGVRYSLKIVHSNGIVEEIEDARQLTNEKAVEYLKMAKSGELFRDSYIPIRKDTPQVIIDSLERINEIIENKSLIIQVKKARQAMSVKTTTKKANKRGGVRGHSLMPEQIVEIMNNLDEPNAIIYQTNRVDKNGKPLPNNVAVFVEYDNNGKESVAIIEFDSSVNPEYIGKGFGEEKYHTVVTIFEPDVVRNGIPYDYMEEMLSNPNNFELEIVRRQPIRSATGEKHPNTSNDLPSTENIVTQNSRKSSGTNTKNRKSYKITDTQYSLSDSEGGNVQGKTYNLDRVSVIESFKSDGYQGETLDFAIDRFDAKLYSFEGKEYYEKSVELYSKYQKGKANKENFFYNTIAKFEPLKSRPRRSPDYVSRNRYDGKVSSEYWYTKDGVIRGSDHWGEEVASCDWYYGDSYGFASRKGSKRYGFAKWEDIIYKTGVIKTDNRVMLRTFENSVGKGDFVEDGRTYEYNKFDRKYYDAENGKVLYSIKLTQKSQRILDETPELKNAFQDLQNELKLTKGFVPEGKVIHKYAAQLKKDIPSNVSVAEIESDLREIYTVIMSHNFTLSIVYNRCVNTNP